jgi:hypothetical protein
VRENISTEMWEVVNTLYLWVQNFQTPHAGDLRKNHSPAELIRFYKEISRNMMLFTGAMEDTIAHAEAWHFGRMGRFLERAEKTCRILDMKYFILLPKVTDVGTSLDQLQWAALSEVDERPAGLPPAARFDRPEKDRRVSRARPRVSAGGALLPDLDQPLTARADRNAGVLVITTSPKSEQGRCSLNSTIKSFPKFSPMACTNTWTICSCSVTVSATRSPRRSSRPANKRLGLRSRSQRLIFSVIAKRRRFRKSSERVYRATFILKIAELFLNLAVLRTAAQS